MLQTFLYTAKDRSGSKVSGTITAETPQRARLSLHGQNLWVTSLAPEKKPWWPMAAKSKPIPEKALLLFMEEFSELLGVGMPLLETLQALYEQATPQLKPTLLTIQTLIQSGTPLSLSMQQYPNIFPKPLIQMVTIGEATGDLAGQLTRYKEMLAKRVDFKNKLKSAFTYPAIVLTVTLAVLFFLLLYVVPVFEKVYRQAKVELPSLTQLLILSSRSIIAYKWIAAALLVAIPLFVSLLKKQPEFLRMLEQIIFRVPFFSAFYRQVVLADWAHTMNALLAGGIGMVHALALAEQSTTSPWAKRLSSAMQTAVMQGESMAAITKKHPGIFPFFAQLMALGEKGGTLPTLLQKAAIILDGQVEHTTKQLPTVVEPALTIFLAIFVAMIALAIYLPMFDMINVLSR